MKINLTLILVLGSLLSLMSQDQQWYIPDFNNPSGSNYYTITGVTHPRSSISGSKNDLFIIYDGGSTYFNSRGVPGFSEVTQFSLTGEDYFLDTNGNNFPINYLYYTNNYEGDDWPPASVAINVTTSNSSSLPTLVIEPNPSSDRLSVNKTVVPGTDIVLILKTVGLDESCIYSINYDQGNTDNNILQTRDRFSVGGNLSSSYPGVSQQSSFTISEISQLDWRSENYMYFNFRCDDVISPALFEKQFSFTLKSNNPLTCGNDTTLLVDINSANDPNYVKVNSICEKGKDRYVNYRIQFYNDSKEAPAKYLKIENIVLPSILDETCIEITDWKAGNVDMSNPGGFQMVPKISNNKLSFDFEIVKQPVHKLNKYSEEDHDASVGFVEFCIKVKNNSFIAADITNYSTSLKLGIPNTKFGAASYLIKEFIDIPCSGEPFSCRRVFSGKCKCNCNATDPDKNKKGCWFFNLFKKKKNKKGN